ncbi:hypothetical protein AB0J72_01480 [Dactylosporangium sp. NPDC049742]|uniref:hypothetical protein n=1 Tax=Dactylosporangium sp. NPDC049742 TaxID=3154737 RepID=UPI0034419B15
MDLTHAMHAATQDPPPTSIDVDQLITGEHRRVRRVRAVAGALSVAVLVTGVVALPQYLSQKPSGQSPGLPPPTAVATATRSPGVCVTPSPTVVVPTGNPGKEEVTPHPLVPVTESCGAATARLSDELTALLPRMAPGATFTNARDGSPLPAVVMKDGGPQLGYSAGFNVGVDVVSIHVVAAEETPAQFRAFAVEQCAIAGANCRAATVSGAELLVRNDLKSGYGIDVWAVRPDGVQLLALTRARTPDRPTPLTEQQLIDLVMNPALTLYP